MKKSELKDYIKEIILAELEENEAFKVMGRTGETAVQSFADSTSANKFKSENPNIASIKKLEETEDEEPTEDDIKKGTKTIDSPIHAKGISPEEKEKFEKTKKLINILIGKLEEYKKDKEFENWIKKSSYASELLNTRGKAKEWIKKNIGVYTKLGADKPTIPA